MGWGLRRLDRGHGHDGGLARVVGELDARLADPVDDPGDQVGTQLDRAEHRHHVVLRQSAGHPTLGDERLELGLGKGLEDDHGGIGDHHDLHVAPPSDPAGATPRAGQAGAGPALAAAVPTVDRRPAATRHRSSASVPG